MVVNNDIVSVRSVAVSQWKTSRWKQNLVLHTADTTEQYQFFLGKIKMSFPVAASNFLKIRWWRLCVIFFVFTVGACIWLCQGRSRKCCVCVLQHNIIRLHWQLHGARWGTFWCQASRLTSLRFQPFDTICARSSPETLSERTCSPLKGRALFPLFKSLLKTHFHFKTFSPFNQL